MNQLLLKFARSVCRARSRWAVVEGLPGYLATSPIDSATIFPSLDEVINASVSRVSRNVTLIAKDERENGGTCIIRFMANCNSRDLFLAC